MAGLKPINQPTNKTMRVYYVVNRNNELEPEPEPELELTDLDD